MIGASRLAAATVLTCLLAAQPAWAKTFELNTADLDAVAVQADGKIVVQGSASSPSYTGPLLMRLNQDGSRDPTFQLRGEAIEGFVRAIAVQADGKILIGGYLEEDGKQVPGLVRLNPDGSRDEAFTPPANAISGEVAAIAVLPDGRIWVGGAPGTYAGKPASGLVRLNPDGTLELDRGVGVYVTHLLVQPDGKLLVGLWSRQVLVRLMPDASRDTGFQVTAALDSVEAVALLDGGKIMIGGSLSNYGRPLGYLARLNPDGRADVSFNPPNPSRGMTIGAIGVQGSDSVIVSEGDGRLVRFRSDGRREPIGMSTGYRVLQMARAADGGMIVAGDSYRSGDAMVSGLWRLNPDLSVDTAFTAAGSAVRPVVAPRAVGGLEARRHGQRWQVTWEPSDLAMGYRVRVVGANKKQQRLWITNGTTLEAQGRAKARICVRALNTAGASRPTCNRGGTK